MDVGWKEASGREREQLRCMEKNIGTGLRETLKSEPRENRVEAVLPTFEFTALLSLCLFAGKRN